MFVDGGLSYYQTNSESEYSNGSATSESKHEGFNVGLSPGVMLNVSNRVGLTAKFGFFGYSSSKDKKTDNKSDTFGFNFDMNSLTFGAIFRF